MSEVSDATQIVLLTARGGYLLGRISIAMAIRTLKLLNTLYHAKWKGKTSFNRLRQTKGEDMLFVNVSTEKESLLKLIEEELTAHQIMFARLPDLCGGDGRTQYAVSQTDAERFKAFLLDHGTGPNRTVLVGPVRPEDYLATGEDTMKNPTPEMRNLERDAREAERESRGSESRETESRGQEKHRKTSFDRGSRSDRREPQVMAARLRTEKVNQEKNDTTLKQEHTIKESDVQKPADSAKTITREEASFTRDIPEENPEIRIVSQGRERIVPVQEFAKEAEKTYPLSTHEKELVYGKQKEMIRLEPIDEEEHFNLYMLPDGARAVVIPKEDVRPVYVNEKTGEKMPPLFNVFAMQRYVIIDPKEGVRDMVRGDDLLSLLKEVPVSIRHAELTQLVKERMAPVTEEITKSITQR